MASLARGIGFFQVPDMSGKLAVVTGGNSGIGAEVAKTLAKRNATVIIASRDEGRMQAAVDAIRKESATAAKNIRPIVCNLESMRSIKSCADQVLALDRPLDLLVNNAGRFLDAPFQLTEDGFEQTHAVNFWGHAYLTLLLLNRIVEAGPSRIVQVVSFGEILGRVRMHDLRGAREGQSGFPSYCDSKLLAYIWLSELQVRLRRAGAQVDCFGTQPGWVNSRLMDKVDFRYPLSVPAHYAAKLFALSPKYGCRSTLFAATDPSLTGKGVNSRGVGAPYFGAPYPLFSLPFFFHTASGPAWNSQAHNESLRVAVWEEAHRILEETAGPGLPDINLTLTAPQTAGRSL
ncbi:retinol dehydrogenase 11 (all-trans/9-cis/11-cis) [Monoraphidium neglectum]|uniref:Retinol dehydrogenase 11 (All-trans/9-cis/11-cis) n=1 Tax=Monoraphidium neglectum TaxID=145388 RepID=A0A0D2L7B2_9CHLO|nr:retinol dehydrogenase 11 (all-trans/9-cis/11-cis) [Monoraphidium neglectum]KIZ02734.1 retinol dehydrogenase 11 (all-trans/9-cis/11-cis) [Monoraphidium neglectum]|eukprot:XP_013901753.1 retinol dehydrogenase 11 (all-trans/9-cis/11-cis) [Monoraphidium neglectum]